MVGCSTSPKQKNAALKTSLDSVSYAIGVQNAEQMKEMLTIRRGLDPTKMDEFVEGFMDAVYPAKEPTKNYALGQEIGANLRETLKNSPILPNDSVTRINKDAFVDGVIAVLKEQKNIKISRDEAKVFVEAFFKAAEEKSNAPKIEAEKKFLEENAKKDSVISTASGLQYKIIKQGKGAIPGENTKVKVNYVGKLIDGTVFDSSVERGEAFETNTSGGIIEAWKEALKLMPVGSKWVIYAPSELAYGSHDMGKIPPYSPLIFEIELVEIVK
ncbi:peptidyl-prolyl cis-trans isomerase [Bacteroidia bacterium]|nr:peptidyl-prolyl cis-trans isomerase [Bacteroidia bacterium]